MKVSFVEVVESSSSRDDVNAELEELKNMLHLLRCLSRRLEREINSRQGQQDSLPYDPDRFHSS